MKVGYIGLGSMGGALAARLLLRHELTVYDQSTTAVERLVEKGAVAAETPAALGASCDVVFLCLPTSAHVREVIFGPVGLSGVLRAGSMIIDQTTGDPDETRRLAKELASVGIELIDAPVSGGIAGAQAGTIAIMVGASEEKFSRAFPLLESISNNVYHAGEIGNGHVIKLVNNLLSMTQRLLSFEAMTLAAKNGVPPEKAVDILIAGGGRNAYLERMMGPRILKGELNVGFTLGLAHKDVRLACQLGVDSGVPMFFGNLTRELYQTFIAEKGPSSQVDTAALIYDRLAGTTVVPTDSDQLEA
ncbi:NAD(P)-dependent oxidoreductase [Brucella haematophila]|uniref:NAD(P)-dependent oxidoreductase n=1 Tax=Brucella haematophila TaxID=419474 RepID=A0ABX1DRZ5_9HYPH|nr:NAD(P)-dependent oxidoreductase [Brucella haematophila]NKC04930.1 NAD(P)-dependent oxidoreductase [Brucella haematophila]TMV04544.1 NAD(P)-dependent oxidoreductase [Brucella haematophila]